MHSNKLSPVSIQISKDMFSSFIATRVKYEKHLKEEKKRKMTSDEEIREIVINEEIKSVKKTITGK